MGLIALAIAPLLHKALHHTRSPPGALPLSLRPDPGIPSYPVASCSSFCNSGTSHFLYISSPLHSIYYKVANNLLAYSIVAYGQGRFRLV